MRAIFEKYAIFETPWLIFAGITNNVSSIGLSLSSNSPLASYGKSRAATAAKTGSSDFVQDVFGYWLVPSCRAVFIEGFVVGRFAFRKEDHDGVMRSIVWASRIPLLTRRDGCGIKKISAEPTLAPQTGWSLASHISV
jgi:hypothetical protein